jgi:hypothetical protein
MKSRPGVPAVDGAVVVVVLGGVHDEGDEGADVRFDLFLEPFFSRNHFFTFNFFSKFKKHYVLKSVQIQLTNQLAAISCAQKIISDLKIVELILFLDFFYLKIRCNFS